MSDPPTILQESKGGKSRKKSKSKRKGKGNGAVTTRLANNQAESQPSMKSIVTPGDESSCAEVGRQMTCYGRDAEEISKPRRQCKEMARIVSARC